MANSTGKVYLVGAGPGDPGLMTLRGVECLAAADLVLYDGLVNPVLLQHTNGRCERTARTREHGTKQVSQDAVNQRLVQAAKSGSTVVRLKGGDPYIFGRGSEEVAALEAAGIEYEVVPGITAATAAGEYAGFSFTHRERASAVAFVTGHEDPTKAASRVDFNALAKFPGTLVFYMGLGRLPIICELLIAGGMPAETPAAIVCKASLPQQQVVTATLKTLADEADGAGVRPPSLIVVGDCVGLRTGRSWFERLPLFGRRIAITRPGHQADESAATVIRLGGQPIVMPVLDIVPPADWHPVDTAIETLHTFRWTLLTSRNAVGGFLQRLRHHGKDARAFGACRIAVIGESTAEHLAQFGLNADLIPDDSRAEGLAEALSQVVTAGEPVLWVRGDKVRPVLAERMQGLGAALTEVICYRHDYADELPESAVSQFATDGVDWVTLTSPAIAKQVARLLPQLAGGEWRCRVVTISRLTTSAAEAEGIRVDAEAETPSFEAMLEAIVQFEDHTVGGAA